VGTRHNLGFQAVDRIAQEVGARWKRNATNNSVAEASFHGKAILLAKPLTYMNLSGGAVVELMSTWGVPANEMLVFIDDVALPLGTLRIRERGGDGGHLGLASVLEALGDEEVPRMRLGIGPDEPQADLAEFVLETFAPDERVIVDELLDRALDATRSVLRDGIAKAMSLHNRPPVDGG
jgi:PTH1 family peptidyl-tRNA hydrolase